MQCCALVYRSNQANYSIRLQFGPARERPRGPAQVLPRIIYVGFVDEAHADSRADRNASHLFSSFSFIFPALKSPAAFHEQRKSLERSKVRVIRSVIFLKLAKANTGVWHAPRPPAGSERNRGSSGNDPIPCTNTAGTLSSV